MGLEVHQGGAKRPIPSLKKGQSPIWDNDNYKHEEEVGGDLVYDVVIEKVAWLIINEVWNMLATHHFQRQVYNLGCRNTHQFYVEMVIKTASSTLHIRISRNHGC